MMSEQNGKAQNTVTNSVQKHWPFPAIAGCFVVGVVNEIQAWHKHDVKDAVAVAIIWFVFGPLISIGFRKLIGTLDD